MAAGAETVEASIDPSVFPWGRLGSDVLFVDLETSGGAGEASRVIEIGLVRISPDGVRRLGSLVNPQGPVVTTFVHGLREADLVAAPTFAELWPRVAPWFRDALVIAHNVSFERRHLERELRELGGVFGPRLLDTLELARRLYPERRGRGAHSLAGLQTLHALAPSGHAALTDAESLATLFTLWCRTRDELEELVIEGIADPAAPWTWPPVTGEGAAPVPRPDARRRRRWVWIVLIGLGILAIGLVAWFLGSAAQ